MMETPTSTPEELNELLLLFCSTVVPPVTILSLPKFYLPCQISTGNANAETTELKHTTPTELSNVTRVLLSTPKAYPTDVDPTVNYQFVVTEWLIPNSGRNVTMDSSMSLPMLAVQTAESHSVVMVFSTLLWMKLVTLVRGGRVQVALVLANWSVVMDVFNLTKIVTMDPFFPLLACLMPPTQPTEALAVWTVSGLVVVMVFSIPLSNVMKVSTHKPTTREPPTSIFPPFSPTDVDLPACGLSVVMVSLITFDPTSTPLEPPMVVSNANLLW
jgi:hypothetical protein